MTLNRTEVGALVVWLKVTLDKYEQIVEMADSAEELAHKCGTTKNSVASGASQYAHGRTRSSYRRVIIDDETDETEG